MRVAIQKEANLSSCSSSSNVSSKERLILYTRWNIFNAVSMKLRSFSNVLERKNSRPAWSKKLERAMPAQNTLQVAEATRHEVSTRS
jgi:hypothetical protein